jgi:hypothetical protein
MFYKGIRLAKNSELAEALAKDQSKPEHKAEVDKIFKTTTENFMKLYANNDDWKWFYSASKRDFNNAPQAQEIQTVSSLHDMHQTSLAGKYKGSQEH